MISALSEDVAPQSMLSEIPMSRPSTLNTIPWYARGAFRPTGVTEVAKFAQSISGGGGSTVVTVPVSVVEAVSVVVTLVSVVPVSVVSVVSVVGVVEVVVGVVSVIPIVPPVEQALNKS